MYVDFNQERARLPYLGSASVFLFLSKTKIQFLLKFELIKGLSITRNILLGTNIYLF